ncbi:MAG: FAD-binding oxidoreductase [Candidatus Levybacteria bacterium]|nr:FAD-binding oxidoreductase [Candidatus Levybacteria bacterium]
MNVDLLEELKKIIKGDVVTDEETLHKHSFDRSIYSVKPKVVVYPIDHKDVQNLVAFVAKHKKAHPDLNVTARAAGTDMSGGVLNNSIIVSFMKYFTHEPVFHGQSADIEPGMYYRDFEKFTLEHGLLYPAYPSSRELCALGGIINNNAGGEKSLSYGKAENYVNAMNVVLADGKEYVIKPLDMKGLEKKMKQQDFEGKMYRKIFNLIDRHYDLIKKAKPDVSKNSAGYYLWNVYDKEKGIFDLTKLFVGAQGTLGVMTKANLRLVPVKKHAEMLILYVKDVKHLAEIVNVILPFKPESLETYDDYTLDLALKYVTGFGKKLGLNDVQTKLKFLPEFKMKLAGGLPNLTIQAEFTGDDYDEISKTIKSLEEKLKPYDLKMKWAKNEKSELKYWLIRRDSFGLLSTKLKERYSAPFIDDCTVKPEYLPEFLPKFKAILKKYPVITAMQGHVGDGNFHVFPLLDLRNPEEQKFIPLISEEIFKLVKEYKGSTSGEHNDGIVRTPYLHLQFSKKILTLFAETKKIFDPNGIFNPHKKSNPSAAFAKQYRQEW